MRWDGKLCLYDQRDGQVFNIPIARGFQVFTDKRSPVLVENRLKMSKILTKKYQLLDLAKNTKDHQRPKAPDMAGPEFCCFCLTISKCMHVN